MSPIVDTPEFTHYLSAWLFCTKNGLALSCIKRPSAHIWTVEA